ncbi:hypothetical protein [Deinococcus marmoris]|uniref:Uncharacterized protein n=1 Tax=Deinococcus marmoris TaxID=249408 RepID=A0A1U7NVI1_9DEIO|nr:hypothetical protein [Deinococcus marmoris]OLV16932.1 hypothetical protein BOO71_0010330 [Deinococcus marmoris]
MDRRVEGSGRLLSQTIRAAREQGELALIASLPHNDLAYAQAALRGGAHALKVHFGLTHRASGQVAPTLHEQRELIPRLRDLAPEVPLGAVLGSDAAQVEESLDLAVELGIDFVSGYAHALPASVFDMDVEVLLAFDDQTPLDWAAALPHRAMLEASVVPHTQYGEPLTAADLLLLGKLRAATSAPLIVPTQKRLTVVDLRLLQRLGVDALMYGVIMTGETAEGFEQVARQFRRVFAEPG